MRLVVAVASLPTSGRIVRPSMEGRPRVDPSIKRGNCRHRVSFTHNRSTPPLLPSPNLLLGYVLARR